MDDEGNKERRKSERLPFREDILVDGTTSCTSMDISEGGLYISTIQSYEINGLIDVSIFFKGELLKVKAQIRYCQPGIGMGVMFVGLNTKQKAPITELIAGITREPVQSNMEGKSALLVEDNNTSRQAMGSALSKEGFFVIQASDGIEAMKLLAEQTPHLIILDLYMKGMDGLKVLSILKTDPKWQEIPVIVCSAHDTQTEREKVMNAGADEFLSQEGNISSEIGRVCQGNFATMF